MSPINSVIITLASWSAQTFAMEILLIFGERLKGRLTAFYRRLHAVGSAEPNGLNTLWRGYSRRRWITNASAHLNNSQITLIRL